MLREEVISINQCGLELVLRLGVGEDLRRCKRGRGRRAVVTRSKARRQDGQIKLRRLRAALRPEGLLRRVCGGGKEEPCSMSRSDERKHSSRRICKLWTKVKSLEKQDNARRVKTPGISYESTPKKTKCQFQHVH